MTLVHVTRWFRKTATIQKYRTADEYVEPVATGSTFTARCMVVVPKNLIRRVGSVERTIKAVFYLPLGTDVTIGDRIAEGNPPAAADYQEIIALDTPENHREASHIEAMT
ncbi:MAG: hypothetical protein WCS84_08895 [Nocardioides sp.]|jgi:hypothetical protein